MTTEEVLHLSSGISKPVFSKTISGHRLIRAIQTCSTWSNPSAISAEAFAWVISLRR